MKIAAIEREHFANKGKFLLPEVVGGWWGEARRCGGEEPEAVVPEPVAFWKFAEEGEEEGEVRLDKV